MNQVEKTIWMKTTKSAAVIRTFLENYPNATVLVNRKIRSQPIDEWCTKKFLACLIDFSLVVDGEEVLSFHDDSRELLATMDQLEIVKDLAERKVVRYRVLQVDKRGCLTGLWSWLFTRKA